MDVNPGDRAQKCGGMMEPVFLELTKKGYKLTHRCLKCDAFTHCKTMPEDNIEALTKLSESLAHRIHFGSN